MSKLLMLIIAGGVSGALYSLIAAGLVVGYTATGIFNLGFGAVAFTSALLYYELHVGVGWSIAVSALLTIGVFAPLLGIVLDRFIFRSLTKASEASKMMATVGILIALPAIAKGLVDLLVNTFNVNIPTGDQVYLAPGVGPSPAKSYQIGAGITLTSDQIIVFGVAAACAAGLWLLMRHTPIGLQMRAVVDRPELAQMRGIDRGRTSQVAWIIGTMLAGLAGVIGAPIFNNLDPNAYTIIMFSAIAAAVIGRLRSIPMAFGGGLALGVLQNLVSGYATFASNIQGFGESVPFVVLLLGLFFLRADGGRQAGSVSYERATRDPVPDRGRLRQALPMVIGLGGVLIFVEFIASTYYVELTTAGLALALVFFSYTIITGLGGLVSLAQAAFVTGSSLMAGMLINDYNVPWLLALAGGVAFAVVLGALVSIPALRLGGLSFALASLSLGFLGDQVLFVVPKLENERSGWPITPPFGLSNQKHMAIVLIVLIVLCSLLIRSFHRSATGRAILAVRTTEPGAASSGISIPLVKLAVFAVSAGLAGLGGVLLSSVEGSITNTQYTTPVGLLWLATVVLWGVRRSGAAIVAALSSVVFPGILITGIHWWSWVPSWLSWNGTSNVWVPQILFGLGAVQMARDPDGILAVFGTGTRKKRRRGRALDTAQPAVALAGADIDLPKPAPPERRPADAVVMRLEDVSAGYGTTTVIRGINLELGRGEVTALVGANGAGKSTLASAVAGLIPLQSGRLQLDSRDVSAMSTHQRARNGVVIAPEARGIFPALTVEENLEIRLRAERDRQRAYEQFPILGERRKLPAGDLSGGEQQMLTLASILVDPPALVVLDEPTLGLAPLIVDQVLTVARELRDRGVAVLLIEEKARTVMAVADHVAFLNLGSLVWVGPRALVDEEQLASAFLGRAGAKEIADIEAPSPS